MKLLLTGANGFVGNSLCKRLLEENNNIIAPLRSPELLEKHKLLHSVKITGLQDDIDWSAMLNGVDVVVHLASRVHVMNELSDDPLVEFRKINVDATFNLARQAAKAGVKRFIYLSSIKVNGEVTFLNQPFTTKDQASPVDSYGISKFEAENSLLQLAASTKLEVVIIRPPLVYGPGVKANFLNMMKWLYKCIPLPFGAIHNKRSLVALDNLVDLILTCISHPAAANQIFLVSDGEDLSTTELLSRMAHSLRKQSFLLPIDQKILEFSFKLVGKKELAQRLCSSLQVDISQTKKLLNWVPPVSIDESMRETAEHFIKSQPYE